MMRFPMMTSATIMNAHTIQIEGVHTPPRGCSCAVRRYDDIPRGTWKRALQIAEQIDPSIRPEPHDCN